MAQRRFAIIILLICLCVLPIGVRAASTADATEAIDVNRQCSLTLSYLWNERAFENVPVKLYRVAEVSADFQYTLTPAFAPTDLILQGVQTNGEWNVIRSTLEARILSEGLEADAAAVTDAAGQICFEGLKTGLYLAMAETAASGDVTCRFESALIAVPDLDGQGRWQYQVSAAPKSEVVEQEQEIQLKILKLWKGDEGQTGRPKSIEVEIFRDGKHHETVVLTEENHWSYGWTAKDDGAKWTVAERNVPKGYTVTVEQRGTSFVLTNTFTSNPPVDPPKTGDTGNPMFYFVLLMISGILLIIVGIIGKRRLYGKEK